MTFLEIVNEILALRFSDGRRTSAQQWVNKSYADVWAAADWPWKNVDPVSLAVTGGDATPTMPAGFRRSRGLYDQFGGLLNEMVPTDFDTVYQSATVQGVTGQPMDYKVVNGVLTLGPTPSGDMAFTLAYERTPVHFNVGGAVVANPLAVDSDYPIWDAGYHYLLVWGAMSKGLRAENDPSWPPIQDEYNSELASMMNDLLPPDRGMSLQYGRDMLGYDC